MSTPTVAGGGGGGGHNYDEDDFATTTTNPNTIPTQNEDMYREGDDEQDEWVQLVSTSDISYRLYYNRITKAVTFNPPASFLGEDGEEKVSEQFNDFEFAYPSQDMTQTEKVRMHLDKIGRHVEACVQITSHSLNTSKHPGAAGDQQPIRNKKGEPIAASSAAEQITTTDTLKTLKNVLQQVYSTLQSEEIEQTKDTAIDFLIGWDTFNWDFNLPNNQKSTNYYRACSRRTDHPAIQFKDWHMPQYFSSQPLLSNVNRIRISVSTQIDQTNTSTATGGGGGGAGSATTAAAAAGRRTTLHVNLDDTVAQTVSLAYLKLFKTTPTNEVVQQYVLKALGFNEYFTHDKPLGSYAYIRKSIRDLTEPQLVLSKTPDPSVNGYITQERWQAAESLQESYAEKIDPSIEPIDKKTYSDLIDLHAHSYQDLQQFPLLPQTAIFDPFHVQVMGLENISPESCPRLAQHKDNITGVYLKAVLFHGCVELPWSFETTATPEVSDTVLFHECFPGNAQSIIANLPRETRVGYVLMGKVKRKTSGGKEDEGDVLLQQQKAGNAMIATGPNQQILQQQQQQVHQQLQQINNQQQNQQSLMLNADQDDEDDKKKEKYQDIPLAWVVNNLFDYRGEMINGLVEHALWPLPRDATHKKAASQRKRDVDPFWIFRSSNNDNFTTQAQTNSVVKLYTKYPTYNRPIVSPLCSTYVEPNIRIVGHELQKPLDKQHSSLLLRIINSDPLLELTHELKQLLWNSRHFLIDIPHVLPKVLSCVDWTRIDMRNEAYRLLSIWAPPLTNPVAIIELLDCRFADYRVREYACDILQQYVDDETLQMYLLQLVQCVKYESYHDSPLSRLLLQRAISNPYLIAHSLYWHLKAEVHDPQYTERFTCILEELLSFTGIFTDELVKQLHLVQKLQKVAQDVTKHKREYSWTDEQVKTKYYHDLQTINDYLTPMGKFQIPLNPKWEAKRLIVEKCRYMSSKMVPLWLVFENADPDGPPIVLIFKSGDDLRQDLLTLQILRAMDSIWLSSGLDLRLKPYNVIATGVNDVGEGVGMIEVVLNSMTTSDIQVQYGGGARGALKLEPIDDFLRDHNSSSEPEIKGPVLSAEDEGIMPTSTVVVVPSKDSKTTNEQNANGQNPGYTTKYRAAVENFIRSAAGYCVATYVLGVADRHNGNIMVTKSGNLFHIDFGHFLGNFKTKFGMKRERAAFVFTPEMAFVMGGKQYQNHELFKQFNGYALNSFRLLRRHASFLIVLFITMLGAGMPELSRDKDINYLRDKLSIHLDEPSADKVLQTELQKALESSSRRWDNLIHNIHHK